MQPSEKLQSYGKFKKYTAVDRETKKKVLTLTYNYFNRAEQKWFLFGLYHYWEIL